MSSEVLAAAVWAREYLLGQIEIRALTSQIHDRFGHDSAEVIAVLAGLDDMLGTTEYFQNPTEPQLLRKAHIAAVDLVGAADELYERCVAV